MAKAKLWKIGSKVDSYIDQFFNWVSDNNLEIGSSFIVKNDQSVKNSTKVNLIFNINDNSQITLEKTKASQVLKCLMMFYIIDPVGVEFFSSDKELFDNVTYELNSDVNNWRKTFIDSIATLGYIEDIDGDEESNDNFKIIFKNHKDGLYSFFKTFEAFTDEEINLYTKNDQKAFGYWMITPFFVDYKKELSKLAINIIHPLAGSIRIRRDLENIIWKDFVINNLNEVENKKIESKLWNLSDVISSGFNISIPIMQRKYVWSKSLVDKLMDDIFAIGDNKPFHYIGSIVYKEKKDASSDKTNLRILDGQQRLTTLFLILAALYKFFISEDASKDEILVPKYFKKIFPRGDEDRSKALSERFLHVYGNKDFDEFNYILSEVDAPRLVDRGNMSTNFLYASEKIKLKYETIKGNEHRQIFLEKLVINLIERIAFTVNKNQIEDEYSIFEKLNTLSQPLNQIDLMKNHLLPYCRSEELDRNEQGVQGEFYDNISKKFEKNKNISEASVKKFVNYYLQLYGQEYLKGKEDSDLKPFEKLSIILEKKYKLKRNSKSFAGFSQLLKSIGQEIDAFQFITDRSNYTDPKNIYYSFSDLLLSFEKRFVYAPLIKQIFDIHAVETLEISKTKDKEIINKVRSLLFEIERYELLFQVVLYRGQSIPNILEKVSLSIKKLLKSNNEITPQDLRKIFSNDKVMSASLISPTLDAMEKKIQSEPMADKVSILILNRLRFWNSNNSSIELSTTLSNFYHSKPSREHIMSQQTNDSKVRKEIYENSEDITTLPYSDEEFNRLHKIYLDMIGNILIVESSDNSKFNNKSPKDKLSEYIEVPYLAQDLAFKGFGNEGEDDTLSLKNTLSKSQLTFKDIENRSVEIARLLTIIYK